MANTCVLHLKGCSGTLSRRYTDESWSEVFRVSLDTATRNGPAIITAARAANPTEFPLRGQAWPANPTYGLYADTFPIAPYDSLGKQWLVTVNYVPLKAGEQNNEGTSDNPLLWPAVFTLDWIEREEAITEARNVEAIAQSSPTPRAANTLGLVTNSAGEEFDEGIFKTVRRAVVCITKNVPTLDSVLAVESQYADTTNSDTVYSIGPRRYQYLSVESPGKQIANGITYFARTVRVLVDKTTDRVVNNVGWSSWAAPADDPFGPITLTRIRINAVDENGKATKEKVDPAEPMFLQLNGSFVPNSAAATKVTYRYLTETPYAGLLI